MTWNVLSGRPLREEASEILAEFADVTVSTEYEDVEALDAEIDRFDAAIVGGELPFPADRLRNASRLKVITSRGVGLDPVDVEAATKENVLVCNNPGQNTRAVAEHTISSVLAVRKQLVQANRDVREGTWEKYGYMGPELDQQTMGVVGHGAIGSLVLEFARGLGMDAIAFDPYAETFPDAVEPVDSVLELFDRADVVSVHAPLTAETRDMIGREELEALGRDGIVVNAARGGIVEEDALVEALREDRIWGAGVDVFEQEPAPEDHPLFELENVIVSPHMAGSTRVSVPAKDRGAAENVRDLFEGTIPESTVNRDELCLWAAYGRSGDDAPSVDPF